MAFDLIKKLNKSYPPLDIENATESDLKRYRTMGFSPDEDRRLIARARELKLKNKQK